MIKILHLSDIHMGSGFSHGRINAATGLNTRLEDFVNTLSICIDRAIADHVDLVIFGGDAFPDATPPPFVQEAFAGQFRRLVDGNIPTVLLVGNHDQHSQGLERFCGWGYGHYSPHPNSQRESSNHYASLADSFDVDDSPRNGEFIVSRSQPTVN
jgi:DNA repair exonuclease SbcCD nuclease subunit